VDVEKRAAASNSQRFSWRGPRLKTRDMQTDLDSGHHNPRILMSFWRSHINAYVLALLLLLGPTPAGAANVGPGKVSFYFAAHEDDWQLFMNPAAFEDVSGGASKTVF